MQEKNISTKRYVRRLRRMLERHPGTICKLCPTKSVRFVEGVGVCTVCRLFIDLPSANGESACPCEMLGEEAVGRAWKAIKEFERRKEYRL